MTKSVLIISFFIISNILIAQDSIFIDLRDGNKYNIIQIGELTWFKSNLLFKTQNSWCMDNSKNQDCEYTNYYPYYEVHNSCPTGWHVSTRDDWKKTIEILEDSLGFYFLDEKYNYDIIDSSRIVFLGNNFMNDTLNLNIQHGSWVQGNRKPVKKGSSFWLHNNFTNDSTDHIHMGSSTLLMHSHKTMIIDKPRNTRRLAIRCVKNY